MDRQYVGARYVPKFFDWNGSAEWRTGVAYEALTIVTFNNASYTSKVPVPPTVGNPANNPQYWALTELRGDLTELSKSVDASAQAAAKSASDADASAQAAADSAKQSYDQATASATSAGESEQSKTQAQEYAQNAYNSAVGAESAKDDAEDARDEIRSMRAEAVTLSPGSDATASYSDGLLSLGIPRGEKGDPGEVSAEQLDTALATKADAIISSASGAIASFQDGAEAPVKSLTVNIEPVQAGSGDPSPDNVRPISGWTGAKVTVSPTTNEADGQTYSITFPSEAGTVYGGTLDVTNGVLTVDRTSVTANSNISVTIPNSGWVNQKAYGWEVKNAKMPSSVLTVPDFLECSHGSKATMNNLIWNTDMTFRVALDSGSAYMPIDVETTNEAKQWLIDNNVQLVYELATPITYHLTPQEITTLLGQNNIWADTGDMSVTYRANTKLYIDNKIAELQALVLEN